MDLSIIIINWNTERLLRECLESVDSAIDGFDCEVLLVDNASSDGSVDMVKQSFQDVILIENDENIGFSRANNVALPLAKGRYILLLNSDTLVPRGSLKLAIDFLDENKDVGALTPKILNGDGSIQHPCYVKEPSITSELFGLFALGRVLGIESPDTQPAGSEVSDVAHGCGCSLFLRKEAIDQVGYLDERMLFSYEDVDICVRIRRAGWRMCYFPASEITHLGGASTAKKANRALEARLLSKYAFFNKYHGKVFIATLTVCSVFSAFLRFVISAILLLSPKKNSTSILEVKYYWALMLWHLKPRNLGDEGRF